MERPTLLARSRSAKIAGDAVDALKAQRDTFLSQGLSTVAFALGVGNVLLMAFVIGRWPQHYWLLHAAKGLFYYPARAMRQHRVGELFDLFELCASARPIRRILGSLASLATPKAA